MWHSAEWFPHLTTNSALLQQVLLDTGPFDSSTLGEVDVNVLPKSTGVIIADGFGITKGWGEKVSFTQVRQDSADYMCYTLDFCSYPPRWGLLQESVALSRSAGHLLQPGTAALVWCSQSSLLLTHHWGGKQAEWLIIRFFLSCSGKMFSQMFNSSQLYSGNLISELRVSHRLIVSLVAKNKKIYKKVNIVLLC